METWFRVWGLGFRVSGSSRPRGSYATAARNRPGGFADLAAIRSRRILLGGIRFRDHTAIRVPFCPTLE